MSILFSFLLFFLWVQNDTILHLATFRKAYKKGQTVLTLKLWVFRSYLPGWKETKKNWMLRQNCSPFVLCLDQRLHASYFTFLFLWVSKWRRRRAKFCCSLNHRSFCLPASLLPSQFVTLIKTACENPGNESDDIIVLYSSVMHSHMCMHIDVSEKKSAL